MKIAEIFAEIHGNFAKIFPKTKSFRETKFHVISHKISPFLQDFPIDAKMQKCIFVSTLCKYTYPVEDVWFASYTFQG
jgi:hypothetical protein